MLASIGLLGDEDRPERRSDREAVAFLAECVRRVRQQVLDVDVGVRQDEELVAAEAVCRLRRHRLRESRCKPDEQGVPGRVAERVVVLLETVEVEEDHQPRLAGIERRFQARQQLAPVAELRERVVEGVLLVERGEQLELFTRARELDFVLDLPGDVPDDAVDEHPAVDVHGPRARVDPAHDAVVPAQPVPDLARLAAPQAVAVREMGIPVVGMDQPLPLRRRIGAGRGLPAHQLLAIRPREDRAARAVGAVLVRVQVVVDRADDPQHGGRRNEIGILGTLAVHSLRIGCHKGPRMPLLSDTTRWRGWLSQDALGQGRPALARDPRLAEDLQRDVVGTRVEMRVDHRRELARPSRGGRRRRSAGRSRRRRCPPR